MTRRTNSVLILGVLSLAPAAVAQLTTFEVLDYPGSRGTLAFGINDAGDVVGHYRDERNLWRGFVLRAGQFTPIDYPGASQTRPYKINARGDIAGEYFDSSGKLRGFLLSGGTFNAIDVPGADQTMVYGLNAAGDLTGMYFAPGDGKHYGWAKIGGRFFTLDYPLPNDMSCGTWISDSGQVAGHVQRKDGVYQAYLWKDGNFTLVDFQPGVAWQFWDSIYEINAAGDLLGTYTDARGKQRAFLRRNGGFTTFDMPGSQRTRATGMNRSGQVAGMFVDSSGVPRGFLTRVTPAWRSLLLTVDDDGADCPGALRTIQEAVAQAPPGATIQVCPGIYSKTVTIAGPEKSGLRLIAFGREDEIVLQGDYTQRDGFHLKDVTNVLIRGFTVRDFGRQPTTESAWGDGHNIHLENAHYNTIENNRLINGDMVGIRLAESGNNIVQFNTIFVDNANLANCGIHLNGTKAAHNIFRQNLATGNKMAGIMLSSAGPGNVLVDNVLSNNGRQGILNSNTPGTWIEGNRISYNRGPWGTSPYSRDLLGQGIGILLQNSDKVTVFDNRLRNNTAADLTWDGRGENRLEANACENAIPTGVCAK